MRVYEREKTDRDQWGIKCLCELISFATILEFWLRFRGSDVSTEISTSLMNDFDDFVVFCAFSI